MDWRCLSSYRRVGSDLAVGTEGVLDERDEATEQRQEDAGSEHGCCTIKALSGYTVRPTLSCSGNCKLNNAVHLAADFQREPGWDY